MFLSNNKFTSTGAKMLATNGEWHHLAFIDIQGNDISDKKEI
jgi:hypothetical protein